jgi:hypothetical protein
VSALSDPNEPGRRSPLGLCQQGTMSLLARGPERSPSHERLVARQQILS